MKGFFENLDLPKLTENQKKDLDSPITHEDIARVIKGLPNDKITGPDGFTAEFLKSTELTPLLYDMYMESLDKGELPRTLGKIHMSARIIGLSLSYLWMLRYCQRF